MAMVVTQDGRRWACALCQTALQGCSLSLFANDYTPLVNSVRTDFIEPTWDLYAPLLLGPWGTVFLNPDDNGETDYPIVEFTVGPLGGSATIYGYFVVNPAGYVIFAERNPAGGVLVSGYGDKFPLLPRFQAGQLC